MSAISPVAAGRHRASAADFGHEPLVCAGAGQPARQRARYSSDGGDSAASLSTGRVDGTDGNVSVLVPGFQT
jgi:hypothetical protein